MVNVKRREGRSKVEGRGAMEGVGGGKGGARGGDLEYISSVLAE